MQTLLESKHLDDEKMLDLQKENFVTLSKPREAEAGNGGDQPARNTLADRNEEGAKSPLPNNHFGSFMP